MKYHPKINYFSLNDIIKQIKGTNSKNKVIVLIKRFEDIYVQNLKDCHIQETNVTPQMVYDKIVEMKVSRDIYLDFLESLLVFDINLAEIISNLTEIVYNSVLDVTVIHEKDNSYSEDEFEYYKFYIWETFICSTVFLKHYEKYKELHDILCNTYFLRESYFKGSATKPKDYSKLWWHFKIIEEQYKRTTSEPRLLTLAGKMLCEREKKPLYTKNSLAEADLLLYQLYKAYDLNLSDDWRDYWFPTSYIYVDNAYAQWQRLRSKKYCERIMPLFGAKSLEELKEIIGKCNYDRDMKYNSSFDSAPAILSGIKLEEVGTLN